MTKYPFIPYAQLHFNPEEQAERVDSYLELMQKRRSVRHFSDKEVPRSIIEKIIQTAGTAPSGANKQPWTFCIIENAELKKQIREMAEEEEKASYSGRMSEEWLRDLEPLGTDWEKPFITTAPYIIVVFKKVYDLVDSEKRNNYYVNESVGLACGFLLSAIHNAGLVSLTHTPSPMNFLSKALNRPENERPFLLIPIGYPAEEAMVPDIKRKNLNEIAVFYS
ncbi:MAG: nitroreductase family protein [Flavobacteriales bacterium]|nr:nitroreductase family protein [Flavobacteriales bacterium]